MEMFNFSAAETNRINRALSFISEKEVDFDLLGSDILIVKTENFTDECKKLDPYYAILGLEHDGARLVFNPGGGHKILVNKERISGLSYIYTVVGELVHLNNLARYVEQHGNVYRMEPEQAISHYYYEFVLWTKFISMKIASRAHALCSWHEVNGDNPPENGCYQFSQVQFPVALLRGRLHRLHEAVDLEQWRQEFWAVLEELSCYLGRLAFYQRAPQPEEIDPEFPAQALDATLGLTQSVSFYAALHSAWDYARWLEQRYAIRGAIITMEEQGRQHFEPAA